MLRERKIASRALRATVVLLAFTAMARAESGFFEKRAIFPVNPKHNHASCVVQTQGWKPAGGLVCRQRRAEVRRRRDRGSVACRRENRNGGPSS